MKFVPNNFTPRQSDIEWACKEFNVSEKEVMRQFELMKDHEFRRHYTDWNKVLRNWMRTAEKLDGFVRERTWHPEIVTDEEREEDARKSITEMEAYRRTK